MQICGIFIVFAALTVSVSSTIFTPCSLARTLYGILDEYDDRLLKEIPLLVCIAGYQWFDTNYLADYGAKRSDEGIERSFHGIFGLLFTDMTKNYPEIHHRHDHRIRQDMEDLLNKVLNIKEPIPHPNYEFYKTVCSEPHVREVSCRLNDYVLTNYKVYEPLNPGLLDEYRRTPFPTDDQPFLLTTDVQSSAQFDSSVSHTSPIFDPPLLHLALFWMTGSLFYVAARYTYDYLHFKYLRNIIALG